MLILKMAPPRVVGTLLVLAGIAACGSDEPNVKLCADLRPSGCTPQYEPTFDNVFHRTLVPSCALGGRSCHSTEGAQGGIAFDDIDQSYALLVGENPSGAPRVNREDPACGELVRRIESTDASLRMPPGPGLSEEEKCAIELWIIQGANR